MLINPSTFLRQDYCVADFTESLNCAICTQKYQAETGEKKHTSIVFSLKEKVGSLARALKLFEVRQCGYCYCFELHLVFKPFSLCI